MAGWTATTISTVDIGRMIRILMLVIGWFSLGNSYLRGPCDKGFYAISDLANGGHACFPCPKGTFIGSDGHQFNHCKNCSTRNFRKHQSVETPCTSTTDAKLGCQSGYKDHSYIDHDDDPHGNNDPDCRPNRAAHTQVTAVPENKATSSPGSVTGEGELIVTPASNYSHNVTTAETGSNILPLYIILSIIVIFVCVICLAVFYFKKKKKKYFLFLTF